MEFDCLLRGQPNGKVMGLLIEGKLKRKPREDICNSKIPMGNEQVNGQNITCTPNDPDKCPHYEEIQKLTQGV